MCVLQVIESCEDKKFVPIAAMLHEVQVRSRDYFHDNNIETAFDLKVGRMMTSRHLYLHYLHLIVPTVVPRSCPRCPRAGVEDWPPT